MPTIGAFPTVPDALPPPIIGRHLEGLRALLPSLGSSKDPLVITGEEGVGKALFAWHVRAASSTQSRKGIVINCATTSERDQRLALLGSDFVSITTTRRSVLEVWRTVVIKHPDRLSRAVQEELGRALSAESVKRPGSLRSNRVRARVILTLRESPEALSRHALLAPSLAEALRPMATIHLPPLRDRGDDCLEIAEQVLGFSVSPRLRRTLLGYSWPRNVAELKAYLFLVRPHPLPGPCRTDICREVVSVLLRIEEGGEVSLPATLESIQTGLLHHALRVAAGDRACAARLLGLTERSLRWHLSRFQGAGCPP